MSIASGTREGSGAVVALEMKSAPPGSSVSSALVRRIQLPAETATAKNAASVNGIPANNKMACNGLTALSLDARYFAAPPGRHQPVSPSTRALRTSLRVPPPHQRYRS